MQAKIRYDFSNILWKDDAPGGWCFISVPKHISKEIRENLKWQEEGWGRMKVKIVIDKMEWDTAIWFDTKAGTYLLPIKLAIRKKHSIKVGDKLSISLLV